MEQIKHLNVAGSDVYLHDIGPGHGKVIIDSRSWYGAFASEWQAMREQSIAEFICAIDSEYFARNLGVSLWQFDLHGSIKLLREAIREAVPWYKYTEDQKELRKEISNLVWYDDQEAFLDAVGDILGTVSNEDLAEEISHIFDEPHYLLAEKPSDQYIWLKDFHQKLKAELLKQSAEATV